MGSGLILLLIVGAWLAVLVPMALRSHETVSAQSTVDRFHDAMRVLSRRDSGARAQERELEQAAPATSRREPASSTRRPRVEAPPRRAGLSAAARRRRAAGVLLVLSLGSLVGGVLGPLWLLAVHALADLLLLGGFLWLRSQAVLREEREWRAAMGDGRSRGASQQWSPLAELAPAPVVVYGVPDRMPARREVVSSDSVFDQEADVPVRPRPVVEVAPTPQVPAARGAKGEPWVPVPVPVPMYVTAPRAPRRVIDLTGPVASQSLVDAERSLGIDDQGPELDHILGRRAVGD